MCASDYMALGLAAELERRGVKVPEDIALVGYDTTDLNDERAIPLTSVDIPARQDGIYVADWVDAKLSGIDPKPYKCRARIHWGKSCGCKSVWIRLLQIRRTAARTVSGCGILIPRWGI